MSDDEQTQKREPSGKEWPREKTGKELLMDEVNRLRDRAYYLVALANAIPDNFPRDANEGLRLLVSIYSGK